MPAKTKTTRAAKATAGKTKTVSLTEEDKRANPKLYIENPASKKMVLRTSKLGELILAGKVPVKAVSKKDFAVSVIEALRDAVPELTDAVIKAAITDSEIKLPRGFPKAWGGNGKASKKVEGKPKGAKNAYIIYSSEVRAQFKADNPDVPNSAPKDNPEGIVTITGLISQSWHELDEDTKAEYEAKAAADSARYQRELAEWVKEHPEDLPKSHSPKKPAKQTAYRVFAAQRRAELMEEFPEMTGKERNVQLNEEWGDLSADEIAVYQAEADEENEGYDERLAEFQKNHTPVSSPTKKSPSKLSEKEQEKADDPENYIFNPASQRYVLRSGKTGKKLAKAERKAKAAAASEDEMEMSEPETREALPDDDEELLIESDDEN